MADDVPTISTSRVPASEVARRSFGTTRRGYDPEEVRAFLEVVARELLAAERREQELLHELADAEERARHPMIDEAVLSSALGQRSAAVLRSAHEEAARIVQSAEESAATLVHHAQQQATETAVRAESAAAERIAEAELGANSLRQQARDEAAALLDAARSEGEALLERAREHGRTILEQAQEARRRVLADMGARRRAMTDQIEQFRAARDEVASSVMGVRQSLDRIIDELGRADDAARAAAADAARHQSTAVTEGMLVAEAERAAAELGMDTGESLAIGLLRSAGVDQSVPEVQTGFDVWIDTDPGFGTLPTVDADTERGPEPSGGSGLEVDRAGSDAPAAADGDEGEGAGVPSVAKGNSERGGSGVVLRFDDVAPGAARPSHSAPPSAAGIPSEQPVHPADEQPVHPADVEDLFARLRARQAEEVTTLEEAAVQVRPRSSGGEPRGNAPGEEAGAADTTDTAAGDGAELGATESGGEPDSARGAATACAPGVSAAHDTRHEAARDETGDAEEREEPSADSLAFAMRAEVLGPIVTSMARRLKRALQDDQNRLLDRLRKGTGEWSDDLLIDEQSQRALYAKAASNSVRESVTAGITFARAAAPSRQGRAPAPHAATIEAVTDELASTVVSLLRRRLEGADMPDAAERIGAAYREWRGERIERLAEDRAIEAFSAGIMAGTGQGVPLRWVRSEQGPGCADCEDNALAGPTAPGEEFPTGHLHPPAHAGCRCLALPTPT